MKGAYSAQCGHWLTAGPGGAVVSSSLLHFPILSFLVGLEGNSLKIKGI